MGWMQDVEENERQERSVLTSFVIVEKCLEIYNTKYHTPNFDLNGNRITYSSFGSFPSFFRIPGIYAQEVDLALEIPEIELISYDLVSNLGFSCRIKAEKTLYLSNEYTDTS